MSVTQRFLSPEWTQSALRGLVKSFLIEMDELERSMNIRFGGNGWKHHPIKTEDFTRAVMDGLRERCIKEIWTPKGYVTLIRTREKNVFVKNRTRPGDERSPKSGGSSGTGGYVDEQLCIGCY